MIAQTQSEILLVHYLGTVWREAGLRWDSDNAAEVGDIVRLLEQRIESLERRIESLERRLSEAPKEAPKEVPEEDDGLTPEVRRWLAVARGQAA